MSHDILDLHTCNFLQFKLSQQGIWGWGWGWGSHAVISFSDKIGGVKKIGK